MLHFVPSFLKPSTTNVKTNRLLCLALVKASPTRLVLNMGTDNMKTSHCKSCGKVMPKERMRVMIYATGTRYILCTCGSPCNGHNIAEFLEAANNQISASERLGTYPGIARKPR